MAEYAAGHASWRKVLRRAGRSLLPRRDRRGGWAWGVPVIALAAGLLFTTSATTADGTALREDRRLELTQVIEDRRDQVSVLEDQAGALEDRVQTLTDTLAGSDTTVLLERAQAAARRTEAGFSALEGPGVTVTLDDALRLEDNRPPGASNDDLLVHQQDVQAVVNALWAGGAEAMTIMGIRVISTSAVICVGPVLLLHGRPYSPPYVITAIGDPPALRAALDESPGVRLFRDAATAYGLGYQETVEEVVTVPAYQGTSSLRSARVPE